MRPDHLTDGERDIIREIEADAREIEESGGGDKYVGIDSGSEVIYGFYHGGDPRKFFPDHEGCSEKELADHKAACQLWNTMESRGETPTPERCESGWRTLPDGTRYHVLKSKYGMGTYTYP